MYSSITLLLYGSEGCQFDSFIKITLKNLCISILIFVFVYKYIFKILYIYYLKSMYFKNA